MITKREIVEDVLAFYQREFWRRDDALRQILGITEAIGITTFHGVKPPSLADELTALRALALQIGVIAKTATAMDVTAQPCYPGQPPLERAKENSSG